MKQYYVSVEYRNGLLNKAGYRYLTGKPQKSIMMVNDKQSAEKYDEAQKNYFLNIFEPNGTNVRVEEVIDA